MFSVAFGVVCTTVDVATGSAVDGDDAISTVFLLSLTRDDTR